MSDTVATRGGRTYLRHPWWPLAVIVDPDTEIIDYVLAQGLHGVPAWNYIFGLASARDARVRVLWYGRRDISGRC